MCESQTPFSQSGNKLHKRPFPVNSHIYIAHEIYHVLSVSVYNTLDVVRIALELPHFEGVHFSLQIDKHFMIVSIQRIWLEEYSLLSFTDCKTLQVVVVQMGREANVDNMHATYIVLDTTAAPENDIVKVQRTNTVTYTWN